MRAAIAGLFASALVGGAALAESAEERIALDTERLADYTYLLAAFTFALVLVAVVQAIMFFGQLSLMRQTMADAETASKAAVASAKATQGVVQSFIVKERARLLAGNVSVRIHRENPSTYDASLNYNFVVTVRFLNYGDTAARINKSRIKVVTEQVHLPEKLSLRDAPAQVGHFQNVILPGSWGGDHTITFGFRKKRADWEALAKAEPSSAKLFLIGSVTFMDIFNEERTFVFAMKFKNSEFVPTQGSFYNREYDNKGDYPEATA